MKAVPGLRRGWRRCLGAGALSRQIPGALLLSVFLATHGAMDSASRQLDSSCYLVMLCVLVRSCFVCGVLRQGLDWQGDRARPAQPLHLPARHHLLTCRLGSTNRKPFGTLTPASVGSRHSRGADGRGGGRQLSGRLARATVVGWRRGRHCGLLAGCQQGIDGAHQVLEAAGK